MLQKTHENKSGVELTVNQSILDSCTGLMQVLWMFVTIYAICLSNNTREQVWCGADCQSEYIGLLYRSYAGTIEYLG